MLDVLRRENKYRLRYGVQLGLEERLGCLMKLDGNCGENGYCIRSLYFDSISNQDYWDKINGLNYRKKVRLRIYNNNEDVVKLELKEKQGIFQRKRSLLLNKEESVNLINQNYDVLLTKGEFGQYMYGIMKDGLYRPACVVQYNRKAYIHEVGDTRITFDSNICVTECDFDIFNENLVLYPIEATADIILEVKYNDIILSPIKEIIASVDQTGKAFSKYCKGRQISLGGR